MAFKYFIALTCATVGSEEIKYSKKHLDSIPRRRMK